MPLLGQLLIDRLQTVVGTHLPSGAVWTTLALISIIDHGLPLVALAANPPNFSIRGWTNIPWRQGAVFGGMPFF